MLDNGGCKVKDKTCAIRLSCEFHHQTWLQCARSKCLYFIILQLLSTKCHLQLSKGWASHTLGRFLLIWFSGAFLIMYTSTLSWFAKHKLYHRQRLNKRPSPFWNANSSTIIKATDSCLNQSCGERAASPWTILYPPCSRPPERQSLSDHLNKC